MLRSFQVATMIYDATVSFCERFVDKRSRTVDQMVQAARLAERRRRDQADRTDPTDQTDLADPAAKAPACPLCGATMALRTACQGPRAGSQFWGCSEYPACKGTRELETPGGSA